MACIHPQKHLIINQKSCPLALSKTASTEQQKENAYILLFIEVCVYMHILRHNPLEPSSLPSTAHKYQLPSTFLYLGETASWKSLLPRLWRRRRKPPSRLVSLSWLTDHNIQHQRRQNLDLKQHRFQSSAKKKYIRDIDMNKNNYKHLNIALQISEPELRNGRAGSGDSSSDGQTVALSSCGVNGNLCASI